MGAEQRSCGGDDRSPSGDLGMVVFGGVVFLARAVRSRRRHTNRNCGRHIRCQGGNIVEQCSIGGELYIPSSRVALARLRSLAVYTRSPPPPSQPWPALLGLSCRLSFLSAASVGGICQAFRGPNRAGKVVVHFSQPDERSSCASLHTQYFSRAYRIPLRGAPVPRCLEPLAGPRPGEHSSEVVNSNLLPPSQLSEDGLVPG